MLSPRALAPATLRRTAATMPAWMKRLAKESAASPWFQALQREAAEVAPEMALGVEATAAGTAVAILDVRQGEFVCAGMLRAAGASRDAGVVEVPPPRPLCARGSPCADGSGGGWATALAPPGGARGRRRRWRAMVCGDQGDPQGDDGGALQHPGVAAAGGAAGGDRRGVRRRVRLGAGGGGPDSRPELLRDHQAEWRPEGLRVRGTADRGALTARAQGTPAAAAVFEALAHSLAGADGRLVWNLGPGAPGELEAGWDLGSQQHSADSLAVADAALMALHARVTAVAGMMRISAFRDGLVAADPAAAARVAAEAEAAVGRRLAAASDTSAAELGRLPVKELKAAGAKLGVEPTAGMLKAELLKEAVERRAALAAVAEREDRTELQAKQCSEAFGALIEEAHRAQGLRATTTG